MAFSVNRRHLLKLSGASLAAAALGRAGLRSLIPAAQAASGEATGFYRIASENGVSWLVKPTGERTVTLGVNHLDPKLWLMGYNRQDTATRYGRDFATAGKVNPSSAGAKKWIGRVLANLEDWGFNSLGFHTPVPSELYAHRIAYLATVHPISVTSYLPTLEYADVFAPEVAARMDSGVREVCAAARNEPNLLGYAYSDRPLYSSAPTRRRSGAHPWVVALQQLSAQAPGKKTWVGVLASRHPTAALAASASGVSAGSWDELGAITSWPDPTPGSEAEADQEVFLSLIVERWYQMQHDAVRRYDPNHLIFGDKLGGGPADVGYRGTNHPEIPEYLYSILSKFVDVVTIEWYGQFEDQVAALRAIHAATGKPILLGDSSFSEVQPRQDGKAKGVIVGSQAEVGDSYARYLEAALTEPYIIGWHFCGYIESFATQGARFQPQNGFIDPFETVHQEAVTRVKAANAKAVRWHEGAKAG